MPAPWSGSESRTVEPPPLEVVVDGADGVELLVDDRGASGGGSDPGARLVDVALGPFGSATGVEPEQLTTEAPIATNTKTRLKFIAAKDRTCMVSAGDRLNGVAHDVAKQPSGR